MNNKRKLKGWVKVLIGITILYVIGILIVFAYTKRIEFFDKNIEQCGSNYCEEVSNNETK